jgi:SnoaL-like domain
MAFPESWMCLKVSRSLNAGYRIACICEGENEMKIINLAVAILCFSMSAANARILSPGEYTEKPDPANMPFLVVSQYFDAMNAGDFDKAAMLFAAKAAIIDPNGQHLVYASFSDWRHDFDQFTKALSVSNIHFAQGEVVAEGTTSTADMSSARGYCEIPVVLTFDLKGQGQTRKGILTFTTEKTPSGWLITGWAWADFGLTSFWQGVPMLHR